MTSARNPPTNSSSMGLRFLPRMFLFLVFAGGFGCARLVPCGERRLVLPQQLISFCNRQVVSHSMKISHALHLFYVDAFEDDGMTGHFHVKRRDFPMGIAHLALQY